MSKVSKLSTPESDQCSRGKRRALKGGTGSDREGLDFYFCFFYSGEKTPHIKFTTLTIFKGTVQ